jgi:hypothetical protein
MHRVSEQDAAKNDDDTYDDEHEWLGESDRLRAALFISIGNCAAILQKGGRLMQDEAPTAGPPAEQEGVEEWLDLVDHALQGVHHALNNRIGSLSALVELYQLGDLPRDGSGFENLAADLTRLTDCNRVLRLLPRDSSVGEEALILDDVLADVLAIHRYLHDARDLSVTVVPTRYVEPVRVERWALVRVLTLLLADAKRLAKSYATAVRVTTESDEQWVRVEFRVGTPLVEPTPASARGRYAELLAVWFGGQVTRRAGVAELRLPTLKARRAADRR